MDNGTEKSGSYGQFASQLLGALAGDRGLQSIVEIGFKMLQNPLIVTDKSWKALAMASEVDVPDDKDWNALRENGLLTPDAVAAGVRENLADRIDRSDAAFRYQTAGMAYPRIFKRLTVGEKTAATVSVLEYLKPFSEEDVPLLNLLCDAVSAELQKSRFRQYSRGMLYEDFIWNLLEGRLTDPRAIEERVRLLNLGLKKNIYIFVFDVREYDVRQFSVSYMRDTLEQMISGGRAIVYNNYIVITASFSRARDIFKTELLNLGVFLKKYNIRCGISRRCTQPSELRFYYEQALDAMRVGTHMDGDRYIYPYGEYAIYHISEACAGAGGVKKYGHPALEALMAHDREYQTHFTASLYAYLRSFKNITNAAGALHLHRNTMVYHLKRIEEIMDLSLDNYDAVQQIELTFRLLEYDKKIERYLKWDELPESDH
ncbi:PucR C-terminal helix-turn-helix domain-containing protein [Sporobacter termitidis DSM 10068]|uniref:PucR C-terminal helix-turn-helix domain-containing protein n=1 Tax=Sporobacter termitidis DSM 10068 TaxID=1123282 RepID=A0A1M5Z1Z5_9FIRM|nr:helix-turn-helix domain-containing protein [Sporobacter termitidis]SHI18154.1 PucR C-terminal helix-turn-helix domain-containing protein [Sporobacter termitidis DSM 10068]